CTMSSTSSKRRQPKMRVSTDTSRPASWRKKCSTSGATGSGWAEDMAWFTRGTLFRAPEDEVDVAVDPLLLGELLRPAFLPRREESERIPVELVDGRRRLALQLLAPAGAGGECPVHVLGHPGRVDGDGARRGGGPLVELEDRRELFPVEGDDVGLAVQLP